MSMANWLVFKFGGTSMGSAQRIRRVAEICAETMSNQQAAISPPTNLGVVVSAMSGVTDQLIGLIPCAIARSSDLETKLEALAQKHRDTARELLSPEGQSAFSLQLEPDIVALRDLLKAASLIRECPERIHDFVAGLGEVWSATLLNLYLQENRLDSRLLDARKVLTVTPDVPSPKILWPESEEAIAPTKNQPPRFLVITGFVCRTPADVPATLGRNGSDYSASIFGYLLDATEIVIWTDVDGVMSADPRRVPNALVIPNLSYKEAIELAYFGAKVIHPLTIVPAVAKGIPVRIKNTFNPDFHGSLISANCNSDETYPVKGCTTINSVAVIGLEISGLQTLTEITTRTFSVLNREKIRVILATAGSPGNSVSVIVPENQGEKTKDALDREFHTEIRQRDLQPISVKHDRSILTIAGEGMAGNIGLASRFFSSLSAAGIATQAIAQGADEINISTVVASRDADRALQAAHAGFYLSPQSLHVGLIGDNPITHALEEMLHDCKSMLREMNIDIQIAGKLANSKMTLFGKSSHEECQEINANFDSFLNHVTSPAFPHALIIDTSDSPENAKLYTQWLQQGAHLVTANPWATSLDIEYYRKLQKMMRRLQHHFLYESTVCGSLPLIETLADITQSGDKVSRIEGLFSSLLTTILNMINTIISPQEIVTELRKRGYCSPEIIDAISGLEIKRALVSLAREIGQEIELSDIQAPDIFMRNTGDRAKSDIELAEIIEDFSKSWRSVTKDLESAGNAILPIGIIDPERSCGIVLQSVKMTPQTEAPSSPFVSIFTRRYSNSPLFIAGPGSSPATVAGGLFADLLRLTRYLGSMG